MSTEAFAPISKVFHIAVTAASQAVVPVIVPAPAAATMQVTTSEYRFTVVGTAAVFVAMADVGAAAPTAVMPVAGTPQFGVLLAAGTTYTIRIAYGTQLAVIAPAIGSDLYITIGTGVAS